MSRWLAAGKVEITGAILYEKIGAKDFRNAEALAENWAFENDLILYSLNRIYDGRFLYYITDKPSLPLVVR